MILYIWQEHDYGFNLVTLVSIVTELSQSGGGRLGTEFFDVHEAALEQGGFFVLCGKFFSMVWIHFRQAGLMQCRHRMPKPYVLWARSPHPAPSFVGVVECTNTPDCKSGDPCGLRRLKPFRLHQICPLGVIGSRAALRTQCLRAWEFKSLRGYQDLPRWWNRDTRGVESAVPQGMQIRLLHGAPHFGEMAESG